MAASVYLSAPGGRAVPEELLVRGALAALEAEGVGEAELSLTLLPDGPMRELNRRWLDHDWVADVLAFGLDGPGPALVGDIYVGVSQAGRQARENGVATEEELLRLVVHGTLHLLGHDHPEGAAGRAGSELFRRQEALVRSVLGTEPSASGRGPAGDPGRTTRTGGKERWEER